MSNELVKKEYKNKIKLINQYNKKYYDDNFSEVSDSEYDNLKEEILLLEKKYNFLDHKNSPSKNVGYKPSKNFRKVPHKVPMLSLSNAFTQDDLENFFKKIIAQITVFISFCFPLFRYFNVFVNTISVRFF